MLGNNAPGAQTHPGFIAGKWYPAAVGSVGAGAALANGSVRLRAFYLPRQIRISDLGCRITTLSAGGNVRLGIYRTDAATNLPTGTAVVETGNISTAATGPVSAAVSAAATLAPGFYYMAVNADNATVVLQTFGTEATAATNLMGSATLATVAWAAGGASFIFTFASAFGAFPDLTGQTLVENTSSNSSGLLYMKAS